MKVLLTGIAGFIGFHVAKRLLDDGYEVVGFDNLNDYYDVQLKIDRLKELQVENFNENWISKNIKLKFIKAENMLLIGSHFINPTGGRIIFGKNGLEF